MATRVIPKAQTFSMKLPRLSAGRSDRILARTENVQLRGKVYHQGGENALHTHARQDHEFFILGGQATFHDEDENLMVLGPHEGILLPAGAYYWFQSTGDENLVLFRFAGKSVFDDDKIGDDRLDFDGKAFPGDHPDNKGIAPIEVPGEFFGV
jgi:mannose-6-phosphate isomerase-like protein (cupin superfamily)